MILSAQSILERKLLVPIEESGRQSGMSYGLSHAGYDLRIDLASEGVEEITLAPGEFRLAAAREQFTMTNDVVGLVKDKSSWARRGLSVYNTVIEPGWVGFLTMELVNHGAEPLTIRDGDPIAQVLFQLTDKPVDRPYEGKYQNQERGPQSFRSEA
jgi:dCTP deaminase